MREVINAIFYVLRAGCPWRMLPDSFPPPSTVYRWFVRLREEGVWVQANHHLVALDRERLGREASPTAVVFDSQSVKTTEAGGPRGYDAGKKINGRKRHALVHTDGRGLVLQAHPASIQDRDGAPPLLKASRALYPFVERAFADAGYVADRVATATRIVVKIVRKPAGQVGFAVHPAALGRRAVLRLDQPQPALGQRLRGHRRLRPGLPLRRLRHAPHTPDRPLNVSFESDS